MLIPFLINHGYYYKIVKYFPEKSKYINLFLDLSLNNYNILINQIGFQPINIKELDNDFFLYYLSYLLRIGITDFIMNRNESIIHNMLSNHLYNFVNLKELIKLLKDNKNEIKNYLINRIINKNIDEFFDYLIKDEKKLEKNEIIKYLDIGSSLSLFLITYYFNVNYSHKMNLKTGQLLKLFQKLYMLCNLISSFSFIESFSYNKKLILFSLFSIFNASPIPSLNKIYNKYFQAFNYINGALLNCNSILFNSDFFISTSKFNSKYFDIFSKDNNCLFKDNYFEMFNLEGNNIIINYNILPILFRLILSKTIKNIFDNSYELLNYTPNIFSDENEKITKKSHKYSSILYYYNQLYFTCKEDRETSLDIFWTRQCRNFSGLRKYFPREKLDFELENFFLNDYLKDLMLFSNVKPNILFSFLINYLHEQKKGNYNINVYDSFLLIFILEDIWNIEFYSKDLKDVKLDLKLSYLKKLNLCLEFISKYKTYIFSSIIILRRILPLIILLFRLYNEKYYNNNENFNLEEKEVEMYCHHYEKIFFDGMKEKNILNELTNNQSNKQFISGIIQNYFYALKITMKRFSEFGKEYNEQIQKSKDWNDDNNYIEIENYIGKGILKKDKKEEDEKNSIDDKSNKEENISKEENKKENAEENNEIKGEQKQIKEKKNIKEEKKNVK